MIELSTDYFFKKMEEFPFPDIFDVDNVWEVLDKKNEILNQTIKGRYLDKAVLKDYVSIDGPVYIGNNTIVKPFTRIEAEENHPVYIGDNCVIGPGAYIRKDTLIGNNVKVGRTEIKGSIIQNNTKSAHHGYIGDSVIGSYVNIGTSFDTGNLKHTGGNIRINGIDTGRRKFGCIIGDYSKIGCKVTTSPGALIGSNVWVDSDLVVDDFIPKNTFRKRILKSTYEDSQLLEEYIQW